MALALSPGLFRWLDRLAMLVGLVLVAAALRGTFGRWSLLVGLLGLLVGVGPIFVSRPE